ncbi:MULTISPECIES: fumarylacetoacetate hydrolase family protein [unclassified Novosphingobium]|uniref:fumarylacetoacetate hydrolase family protein n=1 Tax=unclassified Novosphingobium TaxID=2644732 RepID=UPI00086D16FB|nr:MULTISPECIES: fumarylacetoacetate hydrolase family protein [unclassified Novosphingobium]MBN9143351.1 fumarylacetoacetate hydrolase family protein [Novosphingobium sp.]MDR6706599.1 2-keto-4-pentenoate hydratase/2-oxohepta-3-ene-1,7-dioic acid hydratase in catechol pathway [Novosphingobium sp. 1748]ODU83846.1 MAG: hypothetical protein ABT10_06355 [Novosphingobium sp. SCN 63-17]OJX92570.1 MAG: hypothetical protein BGP00_21565 [Novosphingobium sp. 63-713]
MRIVRFGAPGEEVPGLLLDAGIVSLAPLIGGRDVEAILPDWADVAAEIPAFCQTATAMPLAGQRLGAPLGRPPKIIGVGANYRSADGKAPRGPIDPILFFKPTSSLVGPADPVILPYEAGVVVAETELAVVIGRKGHRVAPEQAMDHVFGYTIANDITAPEVMLGDSSQSPLFFQQGRGKGFPSFCPLGPWIVPAGHIPDPNGLHITQEIDGIIELAGPTTLMIHSIAMLVSEASHAFGLEPGDIILSGSPRPAPGAGRRPLAGGSLLISRIDGIGRMANPIIAEEDRWPGQPLRRWGAKAVGY